jgi:hypothetical protein
MSLYLGGVYPSKWSKLRSRRPHESDFAIEPHFRQSCLPRLIFALLREWYFVD